MSLHKSLVLLLIFLLAFFPRTPLCQVVIALSLVLLALLRFMSASLTFIISYIAQACLMSSHVEPFYISFATWFPIFYQEGTFPWVSLSYTCFLALRIGMFHCLELVCFPLDTHLLLVCNYKALLFFFKLFKIFEKVQQQKKIKKPKSRTGKDVIFGSSRVVSPSNRALYITSIGWVNSLTLGAILVSLSLYPPSG